MRLISTLALAATLIVVLPAAAVFADPKDSGFGDVRARDEVDDQTDEGTDGSGTGPSCAYSPSAKSRTGTFVSGGYRYNYIDGTAFRISLTSGEVAQHMYRVCTYQDGTVVNAHVWVPITDPEPRVLIPGTVADVTERVFAPVPALSPVTRGIVNVGMWLAVAGADPVSAFASASDTTWAETVATLRKTTFDFGNGDSVTCAGAGDPIPESAKDSPDPSPICGYTYRDTNGGEPFELTITSTWSVVSTTSAGDVEVQPDIVLSTTIDYEVNEVITTGVSG